jgi:hypothetical protein
MQETVELSLGRAFGWIFGDRYRGNLFRHPRLPRPLLASPLHNQPKDTEPKIIFFTRVFRRRGVQGGRRGGEKEAPSEMEGNGGVVPKPQQLQQALQQRLQHHTRPTHSLYATPPSPLSVSPGHTRQGLQHLQQTCPTHTADAPPMPLSTRTSLVSLHVHLTCVSPPAPHLCVSDLVGTSRCTATLQQALQLAAAAATCPADTPPTRARPLSLSPQLLGDEQARAPPPQLLC